MIINSSQISMDASTGHMDVTKTMGGRTTGSPLSGNSRGEETLDSLFAETFQATHLRNAEKTGSSVSKDGQNLVSYNSEYVLSRAVELLTGSGIRANSFRQRPFGESLSVDGRERTPAGVRKYYQIDRQPFSLDFRVARVRYESEFMDFRSSGNVVTADGRNIDFSLNLSMHRSTVVQESYIGRVGANNLVDPLVLNFDGGLDTLSELSFLFDMDGDGQQDLISGLQKGRGFLALDLDGDNSVTNGTELFGPLSGSGFGDLAVYDSDENNWIDENDPIFSKLLVWMNPSAGEQQLLSLKEAGVGAISLSHAGTLFNMRSRTDVLLGQVTASSIFLTEKGEVRPIQDVKLAVDDGEEDASVADESEEIGQAIAALRSIIKRQRERLELFLDRSRLAGGNDDMQTRILGNVSGNTDREQNKTLVERYLIPDFVKRTG